MKYLSFFFFFFFLFPMGYIGEVMLAQNQLSDQTTAQKIVLNGKEYYLHIVQRGEGLYRISVNYGVSMQEILDANDDISESLKVGQILRIPVIAGRNSTQGEISRSRDFLYHTVEKGQTAFFVARKYNVPIDIIYKNNPGTEQGLIDGAILRIPVGDVTTDPRSSATTATDAANEGYIYHKVMPQETLFALSRKYNTTVEAIIESNPALRNGVLAIGSLVRIPKTKDFGTRSFTGEGQSAFIEGGEYLYHTILAGQTFFSISRLYQVEVNDLKAANPGVSQDDMKVGYMLRVPRPKIDTQAVASHDYADLYRTHRVRRRETLFGISRQYHVDIEMIKKLNPDVDFSSLRNGTILRIPTDKWFASRTADALAVPEPIKPGVGVITEVTGECIVNKTIGYQTPVKVALMLPFGTRESSRFIAAGADTLAVPREVRAAANMSRTFTDFYSGVLLALDTLKKKGINVELSVYDVSPDTVALRRVLNDPSLKQANLIIGPAMARELPMVSAFSREHSIPMVFPISNSNPEIRFNPYLFQINSPDSLLFDRMADEIIQQSSGGNLLVILPPDNEVQANRFVRVIKQKAVTSGFSNRVQYAEYKPDGNDLVNIQALIASGQKNVIVVPSVREADVSRIIPILAGVRERTRADITLFGLSDWLRMQTIDPEQIHQLNGVIFSNFGIDYSKQDTRDFIRKYRQWYHTEPHAISPYFQISSASSGYSRYGIWGYDVANYFISAIARYGDDFEFCLENFQHNQIQFNFDFKRISNWGGFYNQGIYMLVFKSDLKTERVPLRKSK
jgi:LysM repeat protein